MRSRVSRAGRAQRLAVRPHALRAARLLRQVLPPGHAGALQLVGKHVHHLLRAVLCHQELVRHRQGACASSAGAHFWASTAVNVLRAGVGYGLHHALCMAAGSHGLRAGVGQLLHRGVPGAQHCAGVAVGHHAQDGCRQRRSGKAPACPPGAPCAARGVHAACMRQCTRR